MIPERSENHFRSLSPHGFHCVVYDEWGAPDNPNVVICVHGVGRNARDFDDLAAALAPTHRVLSVDMHLTGIDIRDGATGSERRHDCGGLFVFIGADAATDWLPVEIARDARGYVLTGDDVVKAGCWSQSRDPYLLESSMPANHCVVAR